METTRMTPRAERVLETAGFEASQRGHSHVGTEHLLLALADDVRTAAGWLLLSHGVREALITDLEALLDARAFGLDDDRAESAA
jgi:ATP-dependent Clp protease ATP-binding subunit ClpA